MPASTEYNGMLGLASSSRLTCGLLKLKECFSREAVRSHRAPGCCSIDPRCIVLRSTEQKTTTLPLTLKEQSDLDVLAYSLHVRCLYLYVGSPSQLLPTFQGYPCTLSGDCRGLAPTTQSSYSTSYLVTVRAQSGFDARERVLCRPEMKGPRTATASGT